MVLAFEIDSHFGLFFSKAIVEAIYFNAWFQGYCTLKSTLNATLQAIQKLFYIVHEKGYFLTYIRSYF